MKLVFNLAIISKKGQSVEELIKQYLVNEEKNITLEKRVKQKRNFISGVIWGYIDEDYADNLKLIIKDKKQKLTWVTSAPIKDICWDEMIKEVNEERDGYEKIDKNSLILTDSLITPDKKWHGGTPRNLCEFGYENKDVYKEYVKNYHEKYIDAYKEDGTITIITCTY